MDDFSIIDGVIIGIISLSVLTGLIRGFVKELVALCVWVIAIWLGVSYSDQVGGYLQNYIANSTARHGAGFVIILLLTVISGSLFNALLGFILKSSGLSGSDRILGMGFGLVRGVFIVALVIVAIKITDFMPPEQHINKSVMYSKFTPLVDWLYQFAPDFMKGDEEKNVQVDKDISLQNGVL